MSQIKPPWADINIGMEEYKSNPPGIGGRLKEDVGDFIVQEVTSEGVILEIEGDKSGDMVPGDYTHFTLVKENWDTMRAIKEISQRIGVSRERFAFAGTKDKRAITAQRVSAYRVPIERLREVRIKDITLKDFTYSDENLGLGSLTGNRFSIKVRGVCDSAAERIRTVALENESGFPNYYGHQRFGDVRPLTHEVGRLMLLGAFKSAVMTYLSRSFDGEDMAIKEMRERLASLGDFQKALNEFPTNLGYEKAMLNHLIQEDADWVGAIRTLPKSLQKMFIHAYQSHVFNRALSECIRRGLSVEMLPLVGADVAADDISAKILDADGINQEHFHVKGMSELKSKGEYRNCFQPAEGLIFSIDGDCASFEFSLGRGSYATVILREFIKG
jgi:tRNA pseudouridine13 synthase